MASLGQMQLWLKRASDRIKKYEKLVSDSKKRRVDLEKKIKTAKAAADKKKKSPAKKKAAKKAPAKKKAKAKSRRR